MQYLGILRKKDMKVERALFEKRKRTSRMG
jgi:hypothetical protein